MFNYETFNKMTEEEIFKKLANKAVRVIYVDVGEYVMWGVFDIEEKATYIIGERSEVSDVISEATKAQATKSSKQQTP